VPWAKDEHVPGVAVQASHAPSHAVPQHTPPTQKVEAHSTQLAPSAQSDGPHELPATFCATHAPLVLQ
jgi:hypothetical protein